MLLFKISFDTMIIDETIVTETGFFRQELKCRC